MGRFKEQQGDARVWWFAASTGCLIPCLWEASGRSVGREAATDSFPHLPAMDGNGGFGLEAEFHVPAVNLQNRDLEQLLDTVSRADHNRLPASP
jgi:hypothetical protein